MKIRYDSVMIIRNFFVIVSNVNLFPKAFFWLTASRLTAYLMRKRNAYPHGENFLKKELEEWEAGLGEFLWYDQMFPELNF
jgi:hypothetical protein